jgi:DNA-directed RNA polymerase subunit alpha
VVKNDSEEEKVLKLYCDKEGTVTAGDIETDPEVEIINKDQVIATIAKGGKLDMEFIVANGRGYVPSAENKKYIENQKVGFIPIDALYSPIERISYEIDNARVGQDASYDKLIMEVFTNGSIRPEEAMALAAKIMIEHLNIVTNLSEIADVTGIMNAKQEDSKLKKLETSIDDLDFSVRAYNCLKRAGVNTLGDLTAKSEVEMMKIRNLGKKSLKEVIDKIKDMGLRFREDD